MPSIFILHEKYAAQQAVVEAETEAAENSEED